MHGVVSKTILAELYLSCTVPTGVILSNLFPTGVILSNNYLKPNELFTGLLSLNTS